MPIRAHTPQLALLTSRHSVIPAGFGAGFMGSSLAEDAQAEAQLLV
jgi:hypothetical protein